MKKILFFFFATALSFVQAQTSSELAALFAELDSIDARYQIDNPIWSGKHPDAYVYQKASQQIDRAAELKVQLEALKAIPDASLSNQERINKAIKVLQLTDAVSRVTYKTYLVPFNAEGGFYNSPSFFLPYLPFNTVADYEAYLNWLPTFKDYLNYNKGLMEDGLKEGIMAPKVIVANNVRLLENWVKADQKANPFYQPLQAMPESIPANEQARLRREAEEIMQAHLLPAYQELRDFFEKAYLPKAPEKVGISEIKNGKAYYENRVRHFTTLNMTPDEVFNQGQEEVARIKGLMQEIIEEVNFDGSFAAFIEFLRTDPQFYPKTPQELLNRAAWLSKKAEGQLPALFSTLYRLPFTVEPVPDDIAPTYTAGRYVGGNREQNNPGIYWVNTYNLPSRSLYTLPALTLHEAAPGHHLQITLAAEMTDVPDFRKNYYISAFGEGWGLYSEFLGEEMGMYETPYELFGRYTYEMWRACRLVVDVGLHYKGWTREEAVQFMADNTALSLHEVNTEIDRYIGWPGQAVSYKIGELTIKRLRKQCEEALGDAFNIQEFHEVILQNGSVPLSILDSEIDNYLKSKK